MKVFNLLLFFGCVFSINAIKFNSEVLPSKEVCGKQVCENAFPWIVFIPLQSRVYNPDANVRCTGALISKRYVITLKSCLQFVLSSVHIGQYDTSKNVTCKGNPILNVEVTERVVSDSYDVVLLKLAEDVEYTDEIRPICLPFEEFKRAEIDEEVHTSGWGLVNDSGNKDVKIMKNVKARIEDNEECQPEGRERAYINENNVICVQQTEDNRDNLCSGDDGSPIMYNSNGNWILEGILSSLFNSENKPCTINESARGFKITNDVLEWIVENIDHPRSNIV